MAHLSKKGPWFHARFSFDGREYKRSLKTKDCEDAKAAFRDVENRIHDLRRSKSVVPPNVDPGDYIVWGDSAKASVSNRPSIPQFDELVETYLESRKGFKADTTMSTERTHLNNAIKCLGTSKTRPVDQIRHKDLEGILRQRLGEVRDETVDKERQTLVNLFKWAVQQEYILSSPAATLPVIQAGKDRPAFRTLEEIDEIIIRGGLDDNEAVEVWECLFLTEIEIGEILTLAKSSADFVFAMFNIIAFTGMRRGEVLRLPWLDVDFRRHLITARSLKQSRQIKETSREIDLHPDLEAVLAKYSKKRSRGKYVLSPPETSDPLDKDQAYNVFKGTLKGTRWERTMPSGKQKVIVGFHTFRHSFASNLALRGVDQRVIDRWMGHQTETMRKRYQHLFPRALSESIRKLSYSS